MNVRIEGGMQTRVWTITTAKGHLRIVERGFPKGKLEQFLVYRAE